MLPRDYGNEAVPVAIKLFVCRMCIWGLTPNTHPLLLRGGAAIGTLRHLARSESI